MNKKKHFFLFSTERKNVISIRQVSLPVNFPHPSFHDPPHSGLPLNQLPPVTNADVFKILNSSLAQSSPADYVRYFTILDLPAERSATATFVAVVDPGTRISFLLAKWRYLSIFGILATY